ncbi:unnamed protein product [Absidia cylindrospora]
MKQKLAVGSMAAETADHHGTQRLLFETDTDTPRVVQGYPYLQRYNGSTDTLGSLHNEPSYSGLFSPGSNDLDMVSSLRKNSSRQNKSVESLRSKSWAQCLDNTTSPLSNGGNSMDRVRGQAALFGQQQQQQQQRRLSYGWPPTSSSSSSTNNAIASVPGSPSLMDTPPGSFEQFTNDKHRLTTSHSYSDLHAATRSYTTASQHPHHAQHTYHHHRPSLYDITDSSKDLMPCPQFSQYGMCPLDEQCPYSHSPSPSGGGGASSTASMAAAFNHSMSPSPHPLSTSATYQPYSPSYPHPSVTNANAYPLLGFAANNLPYDPASSFFPPSKRMPRHGSTPTLSTGMMNGHMSNNTADLHGNGLFMGANDMMLSDMTQQQRPSITDPEANRFLGAKLEDFTGKLYDLCKDHNGCRFLQKKLEDPNGLHLQTIFDEIYPHFVELMTDPFGNYLCQKLVERCNDAQRTALVDIISPDLLQICLSMHGTRAIQKLIEYLSSSYQIKTVTLAIQPNVVALIKDLNGNHVIQKCLHRLSAEHNQFIYDIVSDNCIEVATHRHGCCVLQRCIDHAVDIQKAQLVQVVTSNVLPLVQDPFGNYVVQYVLDLGEVRYSDDLVGCLIERVCDLSVQKFSSNVIEKCIRVSEPDIRRALIAELITQSNMEKLLRDSFANYVIQTCLDYADQDQKVQLVERIRPHLASIRSTPYGKRIHSKIQREQQQGRYGNRQHLHYQSMPSLRAAAAAAASASPATSANGRTGPAYNTGLPCQDNSTMAGFPLNYNMGILGESHALYPFH